MGLEASASWIRHSSGAEEPKFLFCEYGRGETLPKERKTREKCRGRGFPESECGTRELRGNVESRFKSSR